MHKIQWRFFMFNELIIIIWDPQRQIWVLSSCKHPHSGHRWDRRWVALGEDGSHDAGIAVWPTCPQELLAEIYRGSCICRSPGKLIKKCKNGAITAKQKMPLAYKHFRRSGCQVKTINLGHDARDPYVYLLLHLSIENVLKMKYTDVGPKSIDYIYV